MNKRFISGAFVTERSINLNLYFLILYSFLEIEDPLTSNMSKSSIFCYRNNDQLAYKYKVITFLCEEFQ